MGIEDIRHILEESGIAPEKINRLDRVFMSEVGEGTELSLNNLVSRQSFTVSTSYAKVSVKPENKEDIFLRYIDGIPCMVLELRDRTMEVNGIQVNVGRGESDA